MAKYLDQTGLKYFWGKIKGWVNSSQHPVNSLYLTMGTENPANLFGGTWKKITSGMLYAAESNAGQTGGSSTVTLTADNLPAHNHSYTKATGVGSHAITQNELASHNHNLQLFIFNGVRNYGTKYGLAVNTGGGQPGGGGLGDWWNSVKPQDSATNGNRIDNFGGNAAHNHGLNTTSDSTGDTGKGAAFSIMPPHVNVYVW